MYSTPTQTQFQYSHLRIKRSSWHYRLLQKMLGRPPQHKSLCRYFWSVVASLMYYFIMVVGTILAVGFFLFGLGLMTIKYPVLMAFIVAGVAIVVGGIIGLVTWIKYRKAIRQSRPAPPPKAPKAPNLTWEYLKAKKSKICPLIEWVD